MESSNGQGRRRPILGSLEQGVWDVPARPKPYPPERGWGVVLAYCQLTLLASALVFPLVPDGWALKAVSWLMLVVVGVGTTAAVEYLRRSR